MTKKSRYRMISPPKNIPQICVIHIWNILRQDNN